LKHGSENLEDPVLNRQFIESAVEPIQHPRHLRRRQQAARAYYVMSRSQWVNASKRRNWGRKGVEREKRAWGRESWWEIGRKEEWRKMDRGTEALIGRFAVEMTEVR
jgi:hypothetical protein